MVSSCQPPVNQTWCLWLKAKQMVSIIQVFILYLLLWHLCNNSYVRQDIGWPDFEYFIASFHYAERVSKQRTRILVQRCYTRSSWDISGVPSAGSFTFAVRNQKPLFLLCLAGTTRMLLRSKILSVNFRKFSICISFGNLWHFGIFSLEGQGNADWRSVSILKYTRYGELVCFRVKTACQAENWDSPGAGDKTECSGLWFWFGFFIQSWAKRLICSQHSETVSSWSETGS